MAGNMGASSAVKVRLGNRAWETVGNRQTFILQPGEPVQFDLASGGCWYGHGFAHRQPYPLNREAIVNPRFAVNNAISPIWMCSAGLVVWIDTDQALAVQSNVAGNGRLEVVCPSAAVTVRLFHGTHLPAAHAKLLRAIGWPGTAGGKNLFGSSIFCTWTQYPKCIDQPRVLAMAADIRRQGYPCQLLILDDKWETTAGDLAFAANFPDPQTMVRQLHEMGFKVWLWVTPFVNQQSANFAMLAGKGYLVKRRSGEEPSLLKWWGGTAGLVDLTNPAAYTWYRDQLLALRRDFGVDGFKLDGGDAKYHPPADDSRWHHDMGPSGYSDLYLALAEEVAAGACETRTVWMSQRRNIIWREGGKDSHWGVDNGLKALLHLGLHMALLGYDVLIADMVPGRVQTMLSDMPLPSDELMVRWTEASAFMPVLQFSYFPWNYAAHVKDAVRGLAQAHAALGDYLTRESAHRTKPLLRPMWYDWPDQERFYTIADQFVLGSDILAAPVLDSGIVARDVTLPPGQWRDAWTGELHAGGLKLCYPAPCPGMPLFIRAEAADLFAAVHKVLQGIPRGSVSPGVTTATYACGINRDIKLTG